MDFKTDIKVELDTSEAKKQARDLSRSRIRTKKRQTEAGNRRAPISGKLSRLAVKVTAGVGAYSAVNRVLAGGGAASPWDAWKRPVEALMQQHIDAHVGYSAQAHNTALAKTQKKLGFAVGKEGALGPAEGFYSREAMMQEEVEQGRQILRADMRWAGVNLVDLLKQSLGGYFDLLRKSFGYMGDALGGK